MLVPRQYVSPVGGCDWLLTLGAAMQKEVVLRMLLWVSLAGDPLSRGSESWSMADCLPIRCCRPAGIAKHWSLESSIWAVHLQVDMPLVDHRLEHLCSRLWHDYILHHEPDWPSGLVKKKRLIGWVELSERRLRSQY